MKKLLIGFSIVLASTMSQAAYMYWQLDSEDTQFGHNADGKYTFNGHEITDAQVWIVNGDDKEKLTSYWQGGEEATSITPSDATYYIALDDTKNYGAYSFYVELTGYDSVYGEGNTGVIGSTAEPVKYADMAGYITDSLTVPPAMWTGGTMAVPEPTSGLLMMMGLALFSLNRRKE